MIAPVRHTPPERCSLVFREENHRLSDPDCVCAVHVLPMSEDGYSLLEALFVLAILLVISGIGAWKFMQALQAITELLALLK